MPIVQYPYSCRYLSSDQLSSLKRFAEIVRERKLVNHNQRISHLLYSWDVEHLIDLYLIDNNFADYDGLDIGVISKTGSVFAKAYIKNEFTYEKLQSIMRKGVWISKVK